MTRTQFVGSKLLIEPKGVSESVPSVFVFPGLVCCCMPVVLVVLNIHASYSRPDLTSARRLVWPPLPTVPQLGTAYVDTCSISACADSNYVSITNKGIRSGY